MLCPVHSDQFREHVKDLTEIFARAPSEAYGIVPSSSEDGETIVYDREDAERLQGFTGTTEVCQMWASAELNADILPP